MEPTRVLRGIVFMMLTVFGIGYAQIPDSDAALLEPFYSDGDPGLWPGCDFGRDSVPPPPTFIEPRGKLARKVLTAGPIEAKDSLAGRTDAVRRGALTGKFIYVNAGHGFTNYNGAWKTQRGNLYEMVEDHGNSDQVCYFFIEYLRNAGATVIPLRDVGPQTELYIVDNADPRFTVSGSWYESSGPIFWGDGVHYVYADTGTCETAVARWTPDIKTAGYYPVFVWYSDGPNRTSCANYRIVHKGGISTISLDQYRVGKGWIWLGTYYFADGTGGCVELTNQSTDTGKVVIADAVRFGSGVHPSGYPWSDMCAHEYTVFSKAPESVTAVSDVWCRPRMAAYMNNADPSRVCYMSFHSNAHSGKSRGALVLKNSNDNEGGPAPYCDEFNRAVIHQVEDDLKYFWGLPSRNYQVYTSAYGELTFNNLNGEMAATILEVAFHDQPQDTDLLKTPGFRQDTGRAVLQGIVDYFADTHHNAPRVYLPDAPGKASAVRCGPGQVEISWEAPPDGGHGAHPATGYLIYKSADGLAWDNGIDVGNVVKYNYAGIPAGEESYFRVAAYNDGGVSLPGETVGVRLAATPRVLIVSGYRRYDRDLVPLEKDACNGWSRRIKPWLVNSFQYVPLHGKALAGHSFDSTCREKIGDGTIALSRYEAVDWISGRESDETLNAAEQSRLREYLQGGGRLFISGKDLGFDLELSPKATQEDRDFLHNALQAQCTSSDGSNADGADGVSGSIFAGMTHIGFAPDLAQGHYETKDPDAFVPRGTARGSLIYRDTGKTAAVQYADTSKKIVLMGFPFEMIHEPAVRLKVMSAIMTFFLGPAEN